MSDDPYKGAYQMVKDQEARAGTTWGPTMEVRMVVGSDGPDEAVGAMMHPELDVILGAAPGTPASRATPERLAELLEARWATPEERNALQVMKLGDDAGASAVDGTTRASAIKGTSK